MRSNLQVVTILLAAALLLPSAASAQTAIGVQPNAIILEGSPGEEITQELRIDNPAGTTLILDMYPGDWTYDGIGDPAYYPPGTLEESAADWLSFSSGQLTLDGSSSLRTTYTVSVPEDAAPGTHWAALFVEGNDPAERNPNALTSFNIRTAHMVYVNVLPLEQGGEIAGIIGNPPETPANPYVFQLDYVNHGNAVQILNGMVEIRTLAGTVAETIPVERQLALPGMVKPLRLQLYGPLEAGEYLALALLNYGDHSLDVAAEYMFEVPFELAAPEFYFDGARERAEQQQQQRGAGE